MCGNTKKDFNYRSKVRLLDPFRIPNSTHTQSWARKRVHLLQGPTTAKLQWEGEDSRELSDDKEMNLFIP